MKKMTNQLILNTGIIFCLLFTISCAETKKEDLSAAKKEIPVIEAGDQSYADIIQETFDLMTAFNLDAWKAHMADDIKWYWSDGSSETRNSIEGRDNVMAFWEKWKETTGANMSFANNTLLPLKVNKPTNYYKVVGTGVLAYTDITVSIKDKSTSVRMHAVYMFNDDKKISHVFLYYDRTEILALTNVSLGEIQ